MIKNRDNYVIEDESMIDRIGKENIGRQFTPADIVCAIGYLFGNKIETEKNKVNFKFDNTKIIYDKDIESSKIYQIEKMDIDIINKIIIDYVNQ